MGTAIVITSGKGGVGKTTSIVNIGTSLALRKRKVCLVDGDTGLRNLDLLMGLENRVVYNLVQVARRQIPLKKALIRDKRNPTLFLLPTSQTDDKTSITASQMLEIIEELKKYFDYVLVDCPAGIEEGFRNAIAGADEAIVVVTPEVSSVRDSDRIIGLLEANNFDRIRLIINRYRPHMVKKGDMLSINDVLDILNVDLLGIVPDAPEVVPSTNEGRPLTLVNSKSLVAKAFHNIAARIDGEPIPMMDFERSQGIFSRIREMFARRESGVI